MSKITVCLEEEETKTVTVNDVNNVPQLVEMKLFEYQPQKDMNVVVQADCLGNVYIKNLSNNVYYIVSLDVDLDPGIELIRIKSPDRFRKNFENHNHLTKSVRSGTIKASNSTLMGRAYESLVDMTDEDREEYMAKNDFSSYDLGFRERKYFWVQYKEEDEPLEEEEDDGFYLNGISVSDPTTNGTSGIMYSDLLSLTPGSFDTILIQGDIFSKNVVSNVERVDGYCTQRLTVYSSGHFRTNFMNTIKMARLCVDPVTKDLVMKKNK